MNAKTNVRPIEFQSNASGVNVRPPQTNAMRTAMLRVKAPTPAPTTKCFSHPLANDAPRDRNGNLSRYRVHSQPTTNAERSVAALNAIKVIAEPPAPPSGKIALDKMKAQMP